MNGNSKQTGRTEPTVLITAALQLLIDVWNWLCPAYAIPSNIRLELLALGGAAAMYFMGHRMGRNAILTINGKEVVKYESDRKTDSGSTVQVGNIGSVGG